MLGFKTSKGPMAEVPELNIQMPPLWLIFFNDEDYWLSTLGTPSCAPPIKGDLAINLGLTL